MDCVGEADWSRSARGSWRAEVLEARGTMAWQPGSTRTLGWQAPSRPRAWPEGWGRNLSQQGPGFGPERGLGAGAETFPSKAQVSLVTGNSHFCAPPATQTTPVPKSHHTGSALNLTHLKKTRPFILYGSAIPLVATWVLAAGNSVPKGHPSEEVLPSPRDTAPSGKML